MRPEGGRVESLGVRKLETAPDPIWRFFPLFKMKSKRRLTSSGKAYSPLILNYEIRTMKNQTIPSMKSNRGGKRPGAGRKKKPPVLLADAPVNTPVNTPRPAVGEPDSLRVLRAIATNTSIDLKMRLEAAKALAPYEAVRKGEGGKKDERKDAAKKAGTGRFAPAAPPRMGVVLPMSRDEPPKA